MDEKTKQVLDSMGEPTRLSNERKLLRACLYGDPGTGKTSTAAHMAHAIGGDICLVTSDSAWTVLEKYPEIWAKVHRYPFGGYNMIRAIAEAHTEGIEPYASFNHLIWDTVSTSTNTVLRNLVSKFPNTDAKDALGREIEGWPHYRKVESLLKDTIEILNRSNLNIIYTAHVRDPSDADKKKNKHAIRPNMPDASYKVVAQEVQLIGWLHRETARQKLMMQTIPTVSETAKSQIPTIDQKIHEATDIPALVKKWVVA